MRNLLHDIDYFDKLKVYDKLLLFGIKNIFVKLKIQDQPKIYAFFKNAMHLEIGKLCSKTVFRLKKYVTNFSECETSNI